jgi:hypothetical protein
MSRSRRKTQRVCNHRNSNKQDKRISHKRVRAKEREIMACVDMESEETPDIPLDRELTDSWTFSNSHVDFFEESELVEGAFEKLMRK